MLKEAIDRILSLGEIRSVVQGSQTFVDRKVLPLVPPVPAPLHVGSLQAVVDYVNSSLDIVVDENAPVGEKRDDIAILVRNHKEVVVLGSLGNYNERSEFLVAEAPVRELPFGNFGGLESFVIGLQTWFVPDDNVKRLLAFIGNVTDGAVRNFNDDGVSQEVTAKVGITKVANVVVPSPVTLAPYRTFRELRQPESQFILRMRSSGKEEQPTVALFEADGGAWKIDAVKLIKDFLARELPTVQILA